MFPKCHLIRSLQIRTFLQRLINVAPTMERLPDITIEWWVNSLLWLRSNMVYPKGEDFAVLTDFLRSSTFFYSMIVDSGMGSLKALCHLFWWVFFCWLVLIHDHAIKKEKNKKRKRKEKKERNKNRNKKNRKQIREETRTSKMKNGKLILSSFLSPM